MQSAEVHRATFSVQRATITVQIESQLFEVRATDPMTMVTVGLLVIAATTVASYVPARRATKVDPVEALRQE